uniref:Ig-like domain-containing protein n=1 Tax=Cyprinus carpio TaxID=7962 RepID=A0A8C1SLZ3_CYPCA
VKLQQNLILFFNLMVPTVSSSGVHTYQRMYGCDWDAGTRRIRGFDEYSYDGQDFITLDLEELRYIASVPEAIPTVMKWNNDRKQLVYLKRYYRDKCTDWIYFLTSWKLAFERRAPELSLLHKDPFSPVECHATGFYPSAVTITWLRNGEDHDEEVDLGELLQNEDGTFQKTSILRVPPDEWKKDQYVCVVEHKTGTIQKILRENEIKSNDSEPKSFIAFTFFRPILLFLYVIICLFKYIFCIFKDLQKHTSKKYFCLWREFPYSCIFIFQSKIYK